MRSADTIGARTLIWYGLPGFVVGLPIIPVAVILPSWYARDLGLGLALTGVILLCVRLVDFLSDAPIGLLCDRALVPAYRFRLPIVIGASVAALGLLVLSFPPADLLAVSLALGSLLLFTGWSALVIPYTAWGAELCADSYSRSLLMGSREVAGLLGMLAALSLPVWIGAFDFEPAPPAMVILTFVAIVAGVPAITGLVCNISEPARQQKAAIQWQDFAGLWRLRTFRHTLLAWLINGVANGMPAVLFPIVISDVLALPEQAAFGFLGLYFGAAVLGMPLWLMCARRFNKLIAWRVAIAANVVVFANAGLLENGASVLFGAICVLSGLTLGADLALPPALQADVMAIDRERHGRTRTAVAFAMWSMASKLALALAVGIAFIGISPFERADGSVEASMVLVFYALVPVLLKVLVIVLLTRLAQSGELVTDAPLERPHQAAD